jgi:hypothetical protein
MKLHLTIEITDREAELISEASIERVVNTTIGILDRSRHPEADACGTDWRDHKRTVIALWHRLQGAIFRVQNKLPPQD